MIRLVAFDVDGTLVGRDLSIAKPVRESIERMTQAGVAGCLVTGRMYRATIPFARELGFDAP
ncbi:MAG: HAD hydrolase family protein, partial [Candidatus Cybelea sp.]